MNLQPSLRQGVAISQFLDYISQWMLPTGIKCLKWSKSTSKIFSIKAMNLFHCVKSLQIRSIFWFVFSSIRTECGDLRSKSPYSVRIKGNTDQKKLRIWTRFTQLFSVKTSSANVIKFSSSYKKVLSNRF